MIPILPRPLLWTEIKTMDEFLKGDLLASLFYDVFKQIKGTILLPYVDEVAFFNELYYQLTRYYYEKPGYDEYQRYYADIRTNLGKVECADLVMTIMFHYCRLRDDLFQYRLDPFMKTVRFNQIHTDFWQYFIRITSTRIPSWGIIIDPQKPCPVSPMELAKMDINWLAITQLSDLDTIKKIMKLWDKKEDQAIVANLLMKHIPPKNNPRLLQSEREKLETYLEEVMGKQEEASDKNNKETFHALYSSKNKEQQEEKDKELLQLKQRILQLENSKKELEKKNFQISTERDEYKKQVNGLTKELEKVREEIEDACQETKQNRELTKQQVKEIDRQMKSMVEKLGNTTIPLKSLVDSLKRYAKLYGLKKAIDLLQALNVILIRVRAWTDNVTELENYFIQLLENNKQPAVTNLTLELVQKKETNIENNYAPNIEHNGGTLSLPDKGQ